MSFYQCEMIVKLITLFRNRLYTNIGIFAVIMQFEMENKRLFTEMNSLVDEVR